MNFGEAAHDNEKRPSASFTPSVWGDYFISHASKNSILEMDGNTVAEMLKLKKEVRTMIWSSVQNHSEALCLIDAIQRLGVSYHFEHEIQAVLQQLHSTTPYGCDDLYIVSLRFRLLRQQGYNVPCDVFGKFKDSKGNFKESLANDVKGLLSLYEAAHLRVHGEDILDDALIFTTTRLASVSSHLSSSLSTRLNHALNHPLRKSLQRRQAKHFLTFYHKESSHNEVLLTLAKLDFKLLQQLYQKELSEITRWWKDMDFARKLPFSRDRIVECHFWGLGAFFEPGYSLARMKMAKLVAILTMIDDIYDSFGTIDELELFTEAVERWDICAIDQMPEYMKTCYKELLDFYNEVEETLAKGKSYCIGYAKKALQKQVRAYLEEAKWLHRQQIPTMEEYMHVGLQSAGSFMLIAMTFIGMGDIVTLDCMNWILGDPEPKIVRAMSVIGRVMNDIAYHKSEKRKSGHRVASAVECYMKQYETTEEEAISELCQQVTDAWKDVNKEFFHPTDIPMPLLMRVLDLVRVNHEMYRDGDGFTDSILLKDLIASLIVDPLSV